LSVPAAFTRLARRVSRPAVYGWAQSQNEFVEPASAGLFLSRFSREAKALYDKHAEARYWINFRADPALKALV
jgi:hypothetical protein